MIMSGFWLRVNDTDRLTPTQMSASHSDAMTSAMAELNDRGIGIANAEFAFSVIPSLGPGGYTTEEDQDAAGNDEDGDPGPSTCGDKALMYYVEGIDELALWTDGRWIVWNYRSSSKRVAQDRV
jgi:hypothetical protein